MSYLKTFIKLFGSTPSFPSQSERDKYLINKLLLGDLSTYRNVVPIGKNVNYAKGILYNKIPDVDTGGFIEISPLTFGSTNITGYDDVIRYYSPSSGSVKFYPGLTSVNKKESLTIPFPATVLTHSVGEKDLTYTTYDGGLNKDISLLYTTTAVYQTLPMQLLLSPNDAIKLKKYFVDPTASNDFDIPIGIDAFNGPVHCKASNDSYYIGYPSAYDSHSLNYCTAGIYKSFAYFGRAAENTLLSPNIDISDKKTYDPSVPYSQTLLSSNRYGKFHRHFLTEKKIVVTYNSNDKVYEKGITYLRGDTNDTKALDSASSIVGKHNITSPTKDGLFYLDYPYGEHLKKYNHTLLSDRYPILTNRFGIGKRASAVVPRWVGFQPDATYNVYKAFLLQSIIEAYGFTGVTSFDNLPNIGRIFYTAKKYVHKFSEKVAAGNYINNGNSKNMANINTDNYILSGCEKNEINLFCGIKPSVLDNLGAYPNVNITNGYGEPIAELDQRFLSANYYNNSTLFLTPLQIINNYNSFAGSLAPVVFDNFVGAINKAYNFDVYKFNFNDNPPCSLSVSTPTAATQHSYLLDYHKNLTGLNRELDFGYIEVVTKEFADKNGTSLFMSNQFTRRPLIEAISADAVSIDMDVPSSLLTYSIKNNPMFGSVADYIGSSYTNPKTFNSGFNELPNDFTVKYGVTPSNNPYWYSKEISDSNKFGTVYMVYNPESNNSVSINYYSTTTRGHTTNTIKASTFKALYDLGFPSRTTPIGCVVSSRMDDLYFQQQRKRYATTPTNNRLIYEDDILSNVPRLTYYDFPASVHVLSPITVIPVGKSGAEQEYIKKSYSKTKTFWLNIPSKDAFGGAIVRRSDRVRSADYRNYDVCTAFDKALDWYITRRLVAENYDVLLPSINNMYIDNSYQMIATDLLAVSPVNASQFNHSTFIANTLINNMFSSFDLKTVFPFFNAIMNRYINNPKNFSSLSTKDYLSKVSTSSCTSIQDMISYVRNNNRNSSGVLVPIDDLVILNSIILVINALEDKRVEYEVILKRNAISIEKLRAAFVNIGVDIQDNSSLLTRVEGEQSAIYRTYSEFLVKYTPLRIAEQALYKLRNASVLQLCTDNIIQLNLKETIIQDYFADLLNKVVIRGMVKPIGSNTLGSSGVVQFLGYSETYNIELMMRSSGSVTTGYTYPDGNRYLPGQDGKKNIGLRDAYINFVIAHETGHTWQKIVDPLLEHRYAMKGYDPAIADYTGDYLIADTTSTAFTENDASCRAIARLLLAGADTNINVSTIEVGWWFKIIANPEYYPSFPENQVLDGSGNIVGYKNVRYGSMWYETDVAEGRELPIYSKFAYENVTVSLVRTFMETAHIELFNRESTQLTTATIMSMLQASISRLDSYFKVDLKEARDLFINKMSDIANDKYDTIIFRKDLSR